MVSSTGNSIVSSTGNSIVSLSGNIIVSFAEKQYGIFYRKQYFIFIRKQYGFFYQKLYGIFFQNKVWYLLPKTVCYYTAEPGLGLVWVSCKFLDIDFYALYSMLLILANAKVALTYSLTYPELVNPFLSLNKSTI